MYVCQHDTIVINIIGIYVRLKCAFVNLKLVLAVLRRDKHGATPAPNVMTLSLLGNMYIDGEQSVLPESETTCCTT